MSDSLSSLAEACAKVINQQFGDVFTSTEEKRVAVIISEHLQPLAKDRERLDWLETQTTGIDQGKPTPGHSLEEITIQFGQTLREALDAAIEYSARKPASSS